MNIDDLTIGEAKKLASMFSGQLSETSNAISYVGKKVIVRTYSAGVHFGTLSRKEGREVYLSNSRRLWYWKNKTGISLSGIATTGINQNDSRVSCLVDDIWLEAIEIIPCTKDASSSIEEAKIDKAQ